MAETFVSNQSEKSLQKLFVSNEKHLKMFFNGLWNLLQYVKSKFLVQLNLAVPCIKRCSLPS
jgi:hypothetical protein